MGTQFDGVDAVCLAKMTEALAVYWCDTASKWVFVYSWDEFNEGLHLPNTNRPRLKGIVR